MMRVAGAVTVALISVGMTAACVYAPVRHDPPSPPQRAKHAHVPGPPPHAPAHGYRHKHGHVDLVFDSGLGVYVVVGQPHRYHSGGRYLHYRDGVWLAAVSLDGGWVAVSFHDVPSGLRKRYRHGHGKHAPPAKRKH